MRFLRDALITLVVLILVVGVVVYARVARGGLSTDDPPGTFEESIAKRLVRLSIPSDAKRQTNPHASNAWAWREAEHHFVDHCAVCHGENGRGDTEIGRNMYPRVPDLADPAIQRMSDGDLFYVIQNGVRWTGMPGWKSEHDEQETWHLVSFVRHVASGSSHRSEGTPH